MTTPDTGRPAVRQATFREFAAIIFRRRWIILGLFAATTVTVAVLVFSTTTTYVSSGRVLLKRGEHTSVLQSERRIYSDWEQELGSEMELAKSDPVLEGVRATLAAKPLSDGRHATFHPTSVDIEVMGKSNVLAIGYSDPDPLVARAVCEALVDSYVEFRQTHLGMISYPKAFFESEMASVMRQLDHALDRRRRYAAGENVVDIPAERGTLFNQMGVLRLQESDLKSDLAKVRATARVMREFQSRPDNASQTITADGADALFELRRRVVDQEARIAALLERYREDSPEVANARGTLERLAELAAKELNGMIEVAESRAQVIESQLATLRTDLTARQEQLAGLPEKEIMLSELDRTITLLRSRYTELVEKSDLARVTQSTTSNVTVLVLDRPGPARPANSRDWVRLALAPAFSLLVGIGLAFFIDGLDITVRTAGHAEEAADIPVLASISERRRRRA